MEKNKKMQKEKKKIQYIHIAIIIVGAILMIAGAFHSSIWFDEAYTVGLVQHPMKEMIEIGISDVHPLFYYVFIKIYSYLFGTSCIALRLFSVIGMIVLSILGYTHIKKDFGEKTGCIFSFLVSFMPTMLLYSNEIRMYSWAAVFVTLTAIYVYRIIKKMEENRSTKKDWILFAIFSVLSAYTHYFAMMAIGVMNFLLAIVILRKKEIRVHIKSWILAGIAQVILYLPGLYVFLSQALRVSHGFWIKITYPDIFFDIMMFNLKGAGDSSNWNKLILVISGIAFAYLAVKAIMLWKEEKKKIVVPILSISVYGIVILVALLLSNITDIFTTRYTIPMVGLFIFFMAYVLAHEKNRIITTMAVVIIGILCGYNMNLFYQTNYDKSNTLLTSYIDENIKENDIIVYQDINLGSILAVKYPNVKQYFYNVEHWSVEEAYRAFAPQMDCIEELSQIEENGGRVWIVDNGSKALYQTLKKEENIITVVETKEIKTVYRNLTFYISLMSQE